MDDADNFALSLSRPPWSMFLMKSSEITATIQKAVKYFTGNGKYMFAEENFARVFGLQGKNNNKCILFQSC